jgi:hypothetical protein
MYLEHLDFNLETDNQTLSWVLARPRKTGRLARWAVRVSAFKFLLYLIRGTQNIIPDTLSRMFRELQDIHVSTKSCDSTLCAFTLWNFPLAFESIMQHL